MDHSHIQNFLSSKTKKIFLKQAKFQNIFLILEKALGVTLDPKNVEIKHTYIVIKNISTIQKIFLKQHNSKLIPLIQKEIDTIQTIKFH